MARPNADLVANFVPTPESDHLIERIAERLDVQAALIPALEHGRQSYGSFALVDPCSGQGRPLFTLARSLFGRCEPRRDGPRLLFYTSELDDVRAQETIAQFQQHLGTDFYQQRRHALSGDGFRVDWQVGSLSAVENYSGANLLFANPPYRHSKKSGRLEVDFLDQYTPALVPSMGGLVYIVPHYSLKVAAPTLASHYESIFCYRFPPGLWEQFSQVVLFARRRYEPLPQATAEWVAAYQQIVTWSDDAATIPTLPELGAAGERLLLPTDRHGGFTRWAMTEINARSFSERVRPFRDSDSRRTLGLDLTTRDLIAKPVRSATNPRLAMYALALTAGAIDGEVITANPGLDLPPIMPKGSFEKDATKTGESHDQKGNLTGMSLVEKPSLHMNVLDMQSGQFYEIKKGSQPSGATTLAEMSVYDLFVNYSYGLKAAFDAKCVPLHDANNPAHLLRLHAMKRSLRRTQVHPVITTMKLWATGQPAVCIGNVGSGKTTYTTQVIYEFSPDHYAETMAQLEQVLALDGHKVQRKRLQPIQNVLVMAPSHLLEGWLEEVTSCLPGAEVVFVESVRDLYKLARDKGKKRSRLRGAGLRFAILSKEDAKLGDQIVGSFAGGSTICRRCYSDVTVAMKDEAAKQPQCPKCETELTYANTYRTVARCPRCHGVIGEEREELARHHSRCDHKGYGAADPLGLATVRLAELLLRCYPSEIGSKDYLGSYAGRMDGGLRAKRPPEDDPWTSADESKRTLPPSAQEQWAAQLAQPGQARSLHQLCVRLTKRLTRAASLSEAQVKKLGQAIFALVFSYPGPERVALAATLARGLYRASREPAAGEHGYQMRVAALTLLHLLDPGSRYQVAIAAALKRMAVGPKKHGPTTELWQQWERTNRRLVETKGGRTLPVALDQANAELLAWQAIYWEQQTRTTGWRMNGQGYTTGSVAVAHRTLADLESLADWQRPEQCDESLWQHSGWPRRYPLARFIARQYPDLFDAFVTDEVHEMSGDGSAQGMAFTRLARLRKPTLGLTGSLMNGKARSLFTILYELDPDFRREFGYRDRDAYVEKDGYLKLAWRANDDDDDDDDDDDKTALEHGSFSERVVTKYGLTKKVGEAAGVKPSRLFKELKLIVPMEIDPEETGMPGLTIEAVPVRVRPDDAVGQEMMRRANKAVLKLLDQIKEDLWNSDRAGRLMGEQNEAATIYDRMTAGTGRGHDGRKPTDDGYPAFAFRYPNSERLQGELVVAADLLPADSVLPKEREVLDAATAAIAAGRKVVLVLDNTGPGTGLVERWVQLFKVHCGEVAVPLGEKQAKKRIKWINRHVVIRGVRIFIANAEAIKTGLNNLTGFCEMYILQDVSCSATTFRQVIGRLFRPGQKLWVNIKLFYYAGTQQYLNVKNLMEKVSASEMAEGNDWTKSLDAIGGGDNAGTQVLDQSAVLYEMLKQNDADKQPAAEAQIENIVVDAVQAKRAGQAEWEFAEPERKAPTKAEADSEVLEAPTHVLKQASFF